MTDPSKGREEIDRMDLHDIARIIRGLEAEGWDSKRILDFILRLGADDAQSGPNADSESEEL